MRRCLVNLEEVGVYEEIKDQGQKALNTNWVLVEKKEGGKAKLCVRGDQEKKKRIYEKICPW